jgi:predicted DNA-binding transcriptional regulator AlpA
MTKEVKNMRGSNNRTLQELETLPDSALIVEPETENLLQVSSTTRWRLIKKGILPEPISLGPRVLRRPIGQVRALMRGEAAA